MNQKHQQRIYHANVNVDLIAENVIQTNGGITINVEVSVKNDMYVEKYYIWNSATCSCKHRKYLVKIMDDSVVRCNEVIESYEEKPRNISTILLKRKQPVKRKISMFYLYFY